MKVHTWDKVKVIAWKDKNKEGKVIAVDTKNSRVLIEGVNIVTRHLKKQWSTPGQIVKVEKSIDASNVMVIDSTGKATRVGYKIEWDKKVRVSKKSWKVL